MYLSLETFMIINSLWWIPVTQANFVMRLQATLLRCLTFILGSLIVMLSRICFFFLTLVFILQSLSLLEIWNLKF